MDVYVIIIVIIIAFSFSLFAVNKYYQKREHKLMDTLQEMIDNAVQGKSSDVCFNESKLSYLENSMKQYLQSQENLLTKLKEQKDTVQSMITDISHQSAAPISNILLYTELLEEQESVFTEELFVIKEEVQKLDFLIQSLVKAARLETGIITVNTVWGEVQSIFCALKSIYFSQAKRKKIALCIEDTTATARFDLKWTIEAVSNITENAIKYTPVGGEIRIKAISYQMFVRIDIEDTGIGIAEEEINKIFLRFYRSLDVCESSGVGIGLYLARKIIETEKGYIKAESKKGAGSKFSVFLPI